MAFFCLKSSNSYQLYCLYNGPWGHLSASLIPSPSTLPCSLCSSPTGQFVVLQINQGLRNCCSLSLERLPPQFQGSAPSCHLGFTSNATLSKLLFRQVHIAVRFFLVWIIKSSLSDILFIFYLFYPFIMSLLLELNSIDKSLCLFHTVL